MPGLPIGEVAFPLACVGEDSKGIATLDEVALGCIVVVVSQGVGERLFLCQEIGQYVPPLLKRERASLIVQTVALNLQLNRIRHVRQENAAVPYRG